MTGLTSKQNRNLNRLIGYSDKYQINIQFWPNQTAVYIAKDGIDLGDYGGNFDDAINSALEYLDRINNASHQELVEYKDTDWINYRPLKEGERILQSDEVYIDGKGWRKTIRPGATAPNPNYTSHRKYRRKLAS